MSTPDELASRLEVALAGMAGLRSAVAAGHPWRLSDAFGTEPEAHWGPPEVLAHVAEMVPFWLGEIERILDGPAEPVPFGRVAADTVRIGIIGRDRTLPPRELDARIDAGVERFARRLRSLVPAEAARRGLHPTLGEMTVAAVAERFVVGHLEEHVRQLSEALETGRGSGPGAGSPA
jgi:hypothetical protein